MTAKKARTEGVDAYQSQINITKCAFGATAVSTCNKISLKLKKKSLCWFYRLGDAT